MKRKKITAILLASLMGISAVPATTWAADSYKETEKAAFAKMIEEFGADYAKSLSEMDTEEVKGNAEKQFWECFLLWISPGWRMLPSVEM